LELKLFLSAASTKESGELSAAQILLLNQCIKKVKDTGTRLSSDHKDLHGMVSKVGKAIDKVWLVSIVCIRIFFWGGIYFIEYSLWLQYVSGFKMQDHARYHCKTEPFTHLFVCCLAAHQHYLGH